MKSVMDAALEPDAPWLEGIEGENARSLIQSDSQIIRVIAGPGTGKTTCLKRRIQRLIQQDRINPTTIFVGTFTRTIANELEDELGTEIHVSTLHSHAYGLLRRFPAARQGMELRFLLKYEEDALLYDIGLNARIDGDVHDRRKALRLLQASRAQRTEYDNATFAGEIKRWLTRHRAMLIGEVVYLCVVGLESEDIPRGKFDHVVIDEYQDLTAAEQELVRLIWSNTGALAVMGDNDQSIYGFRFNHPDGIEDFHHYWTNCEDLNFSDNRRCGQRILNFANLMMAEAGSNKPPMVSKSGRLGSITNVQWESLDAEVNGLAKYIRHHADESFLVLVPRRFIGYRLADAIGSDARTAFSEQVLDHRIAQEAFATASVLADPEDFAAVRAYLGFYGSKPGHAPRRNAIAYANLPSNFGGHNLIRNIANGLIGVHGEGTTHIEKRVEKVIELIDQDLTEFEAIDLLFDVNLADQEIDQEKQRWLTEDLRKLGNAARELLSDLDCPDLAKVMATLRYRIATRSALQASDDEEPRVRIMTLHSAKGLEAENVVIAGVADQFMPGKNTDQDETAEQRRLLYVGVTRARDSLVISWPRSVRTEDANKNMGRLDQVITRDAITWTIASRSRLLPQGQIGTISGDQLLARLNDVNGTS